MAQGRRLRSPRYIVAVAVACGYLFFLFFVSPANTGVVLPPLGLGGATSSDGSRAFEMVSASALALFAAKWWLLGSSDSSLAFSPAEVQFLFPAPISRRDLMLFKIWRVQLALLISAVVMTALALRAGGHLAPPLRLVAAWVLFSTLSLHQMAAALVRTGAAQRGRGLRRNAIALAVAGTGFGILLVTSLRAWPGARTMAEVPHALTRVWQAFGAPLPSAVLWPFRIAVAPVSAETTHAWLLAIGPALLLLALHTIWVLRADAIFEDAAVEASARRADRVAKIHARASGRAVPNPSVADRFSGSFAAVSGSYAAIRGAPPPPPPKPIGRFAFPLTPRGDPAVAVLWKNSLALMRGLRIRTILVVSVALAVVIVSFREIGLMSDDSGGGSIALLALVSLAAVFLLIIMGPLAVRNDLRQDLLHLDVLRTFPLDGPSLVFAEIASSALALTVFQWMLLTGAYLLLAWSSATGPVDIMPGFALAYADRSAALAIGLAALPIVNCASFLVQNAAALLFPAWVRLGGTGAGGLEVVGQRILAVGASLVGLAMVLAPPLFVAVFIATSWEGRPAGDPLPAIAGFATGGILATAELYLAIMWLGRRFERTDVTALLPPP